jgi:hypothetical protein
MKIQDKEGKHSPFDVAAGLAALLLADGKYVKYEPLIPPRVPNLKFTIHTGERVDDWQGPPRLFYHCGSCGQSGHWTGPTAHLTQIVHHCGVHETCPPDVAKDYQARRRVWESRSRNKRQLRPELGASAAVIAHRDQLEAERLGYKSRETLIAEAKRGCALNPSAKVGV